MIVCNNEGEVKSSEREVKSNEGNAKQCSEKEGNMIRYLKEMNAKLYEALEKDDSKTPSNQQAWIIYKILFVKTKYIYRMFKSNQITQELIRHLARIKEIDGGLMKYWGRKGYENLCCTRCAKKRDAEDAKKGDGASRHPAACICRVPRSKLKEKVAIRCEFCGCNGCGGFR